MYGAVVVRALRSYPAPVEVMTPSYLNEVHWSGRVGAHNRPAGVTGAVSARQVMCISTPIQVTVGDPGRQRASQEWQSGPPRHFCQRTDGDAPLQEGDRCRCSGRRTVSRRQKVVREVTGPVLKTFERARSGAGTRTALYEAGGPSTPDHSARAAPRAAAPGRALSGAPFRLVVAMPDHRLVANGVRLSVPLRLLTAGQELPGSSPGCRMNRSKEQSP